MNENENVRRHYVYVGRRLFGTDGRKLSVGLILIPADETGAEMLEGVPMPDEAKPTWWTLGARSLRSFAHVSPGAIITIEGRLDSDGRPHSIAPSTLRTTALRWPKEEDRLLWTAEDRMACVEAERRREMKGRNELHEALEPVRRIFHEMHGRNRTALLAEIVHYVTH